MNQEIEQFVQQMRASGKADTEIILQLKNAGWKESIIATVLSDASYNIPRYFRPGRLWDVLTLFPIISVGILALMIYFESQRMLSNFPAMSISGQIGSPIQFVFSLLISLIAILITALDFGYLLVNRRQVFASGGDLSLFVTALILQPIFLPYLHFRHLRGLSRNKSLGIVISAILLTGILALPIIIRQFLFFSDIVKFQRNIYRILNTPGFTRK